MYILYHAQSIAYIILHNNYIHHIHAQIQWIRNNSDALCSILYEHSIRVEYYTYLLKTANGENLLWLVWWQHATRRRRDGRLYSKPVVCILFVPGRYFTLFHKFFFFILPFGPQQQCNIAEHSRALIS